MPRLATECQNRMVEEGECAENRQTCKEINRL